MHLFSYTVITLVWFWVIKFYFNIIHLKLTATCTTWGYNSAKRGTYFIVKVRGRFVSSYFTISILNPVSYLERHTVYNCLVAIMYMNQ